MNVFFAISAIFSQCAVHLKKKKIHPILCTLYIRAPTHKIVHAILWTIRFNLLPKKKFKKKIPKNLFSIFVCIYFPKQENYIYKTHSGPCIYYVYLKKAYNAFVCIVFPLFFFFKMCEKKILSWALLVFIFITSYVFSSWLYPR